VTPVDMFFYYLGLGVMCGVIAATVSHFMRRWF